MKKTLFFILILLNLCIFINGCGDSSATDRDEAGTTASETNPFLNDTGNTNLGAFSFGIVSDNYEKQVYEYDGKELHIPFKVSGMDEKLSSEFGLMVFVDGLPQPYKIVKSDGTVVKEEYMQKFCLANKEIQEFDIVFTPVAGKKGDRVGVVFSTVLKPDFMPPSDKNPNYGIYHSLNATVAQEINFKWDAPADIQLQAYKKYSTGDIPQDKEAVPGIIVNDSHKPSEDRLITQLSSQSKNQEVFDGVNGKINFELQLYGGTEATYRTVLFINHKPVRIMDSDYIETRIKKDKLCTVKLALDIGSYPPLNTLYAITTPAGKDYMAVSYFPVKTRSVLAVNDK